MILQQLQRYYERLAADNAVAPMGFSVQRIAFELLLEKDGSVVLIKDVREPAKPQPRGRAMTVPGGAKPSGSGLNPSVFGWDRTDYMLGYLNPEIFPKEEREKKLRRCHEAHEAYVEAMLSSQGEIATDDYDSFCAFLRNWQAEDAEQWPRLAELSGGFGVVRVGRDSRTYLHEIPALQERAGSASKDGASGMCLVTGETATIALTHAPKIKGVNGAQTAGAAVVSFNFSAAESYGRKQSANGPVSAESAFKYCTALNKLLERDGGHRLQIGDDTCVFWADQPTLAEDVFGFGLSGNLPEDKDRAKEIANTLSAMVQGHARAPDAGVGFHVLSLAPNAARLSVRFWNSGTVEAQLAGVIQHQRDLELAHGAKESGQLPIWRLLLQTAREKKDVPPLLAGALFRSVLTGTRYPESLFAAVIRRIRAEQDISYPKAAIIKAILNRNHGKEVSVSLDKNRPDPAYQLGRLFAALEKAQEDALGGINASIKDRYFGAASATPASVFPRLIRMSQHHLGKLDGGRKVVAEKRIQEIAGQLDDFPRHLGLVEQGLFALGYYHQRQDFFTKKTDTPQD